MEVKVVDTQTVHPFAQNTVVRRIKNEVLALMEEQTSAICSAAFVGMTSSQAKQYEERCQKIATLVDELIRIEEPRRN